MNWGMNGKILTRKRKERRLTAKYKKKISSSLTWDWPAAVVKFCSYHHPPDAHLQSSPLISSSSLQCPWNPFLNCHVKSSPNNQISDSCWSWSQSSAGIDLWFASKSHGGWRCEGERVSCSFWGLGFLSEWTGPQVPF